jgi:sulfonate transport system substrate-binding protein
MQNLRRVILFPLLALAVLLAVPAFAAPALRISGWSLPFNLPVMVEREKDTYAETFPDFEVSMVDLQTGPRLLTALATGDLDIVQGVGDAAFMVSFASGLDARIVAVNSRSPKAFGVVTNNPDVRTIADLRGKRVAGLRGSVVHEVLVGALGEHGMTEADVEFFPMPVATAASTLLAGRVDAALLVGVELLRACESGARVLADGEGRVRGLSLVIASNRFIRDHRDAVDRYVEMRKKTVSYIEANPDEATAAASRRTRLSGGDLATMMDWYDFGADISTADVDSMRDTMRYLMDSGAISAPVDIDAMFMK